LFLRGAPLLNEKTLWNVFFFAFHQISDISVSVMKTLETILKRTTEALLAITVSSAISLMIGLALAFTIEHLAGSCHAFAIVEFGLCVFPLFLVLTFDGFRDCKL